MLAMDPCQTCSVNHRQQRLSATRLYLVCDARPDGFLHAALRGGVDVVQLRLKESPDEEILTAAQRFKRACEAHGALFILNDRPELAAAADADGVHLGQDDVAVPDARAMVGSERLIGLSTHTAEQVVGVRAVDYIGVGPIHATPTKPGRPPVGLELVRYAAARASVPFFAIGGIDVDNARAVRDAGARRIAVVRALTEAVDPERAARELRAALDPGGTARELGAAGEGQVRLGAT